MGGSGGDRPRSISEHDVAFAQDLLADRLFVLLDEFRLERDRYVKGRLDQALEDLALLIAID